MSEIKENPSEFKRILTASDGSEAAKRATSVAIGLAKRYQAALIILTVIPTPAALSASGYPMNIASFEEGWKKQAETIVGDVASLARGEGVSVEAKIIENMSSAVHAIVSFAQSENVDLIVVGTRGNGEFKKLLLGSVSSGVVDHAPCSVLVIR